jgi:hypothetical protein
VDESAATDGADLAVAKKAGAGVRAEEFFEDAGVVIFFAEEVSSAPGAGEDE